MSPFVFFPSLFMSPRRMVQHPRTDSPAASGRDRRPKDRDPAERPGRQAAHRARRRERRPLGAGHGAGGGAAWSGATRWLERRTRHGVPCFVFLFWWRGWLTGLILFGKEILRCEVVKTSTGKGVDHASCHASCLMGRSWPVRC